MTLPVYVHLKPGDALPKLRNANFFKAILVIEADAPTAWRDATADWLVGSGCRYLSAWGRSCGTWHDCVDLANLRAFDFAEIPDDDFVMTTWHAKEPLKDVFWFVGQSAAHPTVSIEETYIIHIAPNERSAELLEAFHNAQILEG
jgi:hypothetical protein